MIDIKKWLLYALLTSFIIGMFGTLVTLFLKFLNSDAIKMILSGLFMGFGSFFGTYFGTHVKEKIMEKNTKDKE